jgi:O-acetylhomoserine/O-acetylserine sulfhydrylase-like pyridoxal-dependent enzyme
LTRYYEKYKKYKYRSCGCLFNFSVAQVAIGKQVVDGNSTVLDFNNVAGNTKGLILPATSGVPPDHW